MYQQVYLPYRTGTLCILRLLCLLILLQLHSHAPTVPSLLHLPSHIYVTVGSIDTQLPSLLSLVYVIFLLVYYFIITLSSYMPYTVASYTYSFLFKYTQLSYLQLLSQPLNLLYIATHLVYICTGVTYVIITSQATNLSP